MAREAADDNVNRCKCRQAGAHVFVLAGMGKSVLQHGAASGVDLNLPGRLKTCCFEADIESADAGEEAADGGFIVMGFDLGIHCVLSRQWDARRHSQLLKS